LTSAFRLHRTRRPFRSLFGLLVAVLLVVMPFGTASAQPASPTTKGAAKPAASEKINLDVLEGAWVRPDGGYVILIKKVGANGQLEASYFNPQPLPFAKAQVTREGTAVRLAFELQAGGYSGSTYDLVYDAASDRLKGVYYQAVMKQRFEVHFVRK
jgi:uncharacterized protein (DUF2147 family)